MKGKYSDDHLQVLRYWWVLELFSPQKVPKLTGRATRPDDRQVIEWRSSKPLPWNTLPPPKPWGKKRRRWKHTLYLGVYDLEDTYERLHKVFGDDPDAYDARRGGLSACAGVLLDEHGELVPNSAVLSSALWAVARLNRKLPSLATWGDEFERAGKRFGEEIDDFDGDRRESLSANSTASHDEKSMAELVRIAQEASSITGDPRLATSRIIIDSVAIIERPDDDSPPRSDFLNSFFLDDLAALADDVEGKECPPALSHYLTPDEAAKAVARVDVMVDKRTVDNGVKIERLPKGRWPSNPEHGLALRQQFAVNHALNELLDTRGLMSVNGPPGTGKTTMLRDLLAGNVVERARRLASMESAADAFTSATHCWKSNEGYPLRIRQLREDLTGFEMVVASANNAAVENVSDEIPAREAISEPWKAAADYFADIATATMKNADLAPVEGGEPATSANSMQASGAWGLVAARLGTKSNRSEFRFNFWFDKTYKGTTERIPGTAPRMQSRLKQWLDGTVAVPDWQDSRAAFHHAERRVDSLVAMRKEAQSRVDELAGAIDAHRRTTAQVQELRKEAARVFSEARAYDSVLQNVNREHASAAAMRDRHVQVKPGFLEALFSGGRATRDWRMRLLPLEDNLRSVELRHRQIYAHATDLEARSQWLHSELQRAEAARALAARDEDELRQRIGADSTYFGKGYPGPDWVGDEREKRAPWLDAELDAARSELFLAALQLHQDFLANNAKDMLRALRASMNVVSGEAPSKLEASTRLAAWQTFFLVVPLVSTTFASFARMFSGLERESLGWLFIDEAGQASPQYAAGAIWRSRRVVVVGDPQQLQPVVTIPNKAQLDIATAYQVSPTWIPPRASTQTLADRVSTFGTTLRSAERSVWVSAPLTVHRRCDEPMFGLCNEIAYSGIMVSGVHRLLNDPEVPDKFDGPDGPEIAASKWLDEPATLAGTHLQPKQTERLRQEIENLLSGGIEARDIIAISPFREVADALATLSRTYPGMTAGTIHTAQGRESDIVFFVLGGDPTAPGAKAWAASTVNLVNVAASRAKRRLYVIGDRATWSKYNNFQQLSVALTPTDS